jgi:hypothetical protein
MLRTPGRRRAALVLGGLVAGLALAEAILAMKPERAGSDVEVEKPAGEAYRLKDEALGYAPTAGVVARATKSQDGRKLYDVHYRIDEHGLRRTPGNPHGRGFLFFGCSFTFGEGVEDEETMPWAFSEALGFRANVRNLGFHGYGPHQMLRALETERTRGLVAGGVAHVFYQALHGHMRRAAGRSPWDPAGPRYEIVGGELRYLGPFHSPLVAFGIRALNRVALFRRPRNRILWQSPDRPEDAERFLAIVARSREIVRERWGAGFTVVYWDDEGDPLPDRLVERGLDVVRVSQIVPRERWPELQIPVDAHPASAAHRAIGKYLAQRWDERGTLASAEP